MQAATNPESRVYSPYGKESCETTHHIIVTYSQPRK